MSIHILTIGKVTKHFLAKTELQDTTLISLELAKYFTVVWRIISNRFDLNVALEHDSTKEFSLAIIRQTSSAIRQ